MRNKNFTLLFASLLGFLVAFTSCNDDDDDPQNLSGTWTITSITGDGASGLSNLEGGQLSFTGETEGTYVIRESDGSEVEQGNFSFTNSTFTFNGSTIFVNTASGSISGNTLTLTTDLQGTEGKPAANVTITLTKN
ncbi:MAG: hypothetical protein ACFB0B_03195 [Thermonemataceae bacterium]